MYINVALNRNAQSFSIEDTLNKPYISYSAHTTLENINTVLTLQNTYTNMSSNAQYHDLPPNELRTTLGTLARRVEEAYQRKADSLSLSNKWLFDVWNSQRKIASLYKRIQHQISPPLMLEPLPSEVVKNILSFADIKILGRCAQLNKNAMQLTGEEFINRAQIFGGSLMNSQNSKQYLKGFFNAVDERFISLVANTSRVVDGYFFEALRKEFTILNAKKQYHQLADQSKIEMQAHIKHEISSSIFRQDIHRVRAYLYMGESFNLDLHEFLASCTQMQSGRYEIFQELLQKGAKLNEMYYGFAPLHWAVKYNRESFVQTLLIYKANIDLLSETTNETALHLAITNYMNNVHTPYFNENILNLLLDNGVNLDLRNAKGETALHLTIEKRNWRYFGKLIEHGANPDIPDNTGKTARMYLKNLVTGPFGANWDVVSQVAQLTNAI